MRDTETDRLTYYIFLPYLVACLALGGLYIWSNIGEPFRGTVEINLSPELVDQRIMIYVPCEYVGNDSIKKDCTQKLNNSVIKE